MMREMKVRITSLLFAILFSSATTLVSAADVTAQTDQSRGLRSDPTSSRGAGARDAELNTSVSILAGQFIYSDDAYPYAGGRLDRSFGKYVEGELGVGYARVSTRIYSLAPTITYYSVLTPLLSGDGALHLMLPIRQFTPYVGLSGGFFRRSGNAALGNLQTTGSSLGLIGGAKLFIGRMLGVRAEFHYRSDKHNGSNWRSNDAEQFVGLIYRF